MLKDINKETFLFELGKAERYFAKADKFVCLSHFIKFHLGKLGFYYSSSIRIAKSLQISGDIEIYKFTPSTYTAAVVAIRSRDQSSDNDSIQIIPASKTVRSTYLRWRGRVNSTF